MSTAHRAARATVEGFAALLLWSSLASLTALAAPMPPFELAAMTFAIGTLVGLVYARMSRQPLLGLKAMPVGALALGVYGLLGYHACYFYALQQAPPLEANLVNYLWPLLIVVFSGLLPARAGGKPLRWRHVAGALLGFGGTLLVLIEGGAELSFGGAGAGYAAALAGALIWSSYSVASRLFHAVPSTAVTASCGATALGAFVLHVFSETTVLPKDVVAWSAVLAMGLGPVGLAFYLWDRGMKQGELRLLGVASYATPLFSTALLALLGLGTAGPMLWLAALLVTAGALIAASDSVRPARAPGTAQ
ncbi:MAG TPA: EamA family transporter [Hyphomicrobiaceae bacterium]|nr:EamA family transporter [Hyphomicrobiaceae bacterium]